MFDAVELTREKSMLGGWFVVFILASVWECILPLLSGAFALQKNLIILSLICIMHLSGKVDHDVLFY